MSPTATAPPAGIVFATEVVVCVTTAAGPRRRPGSAAMFASQYVNRLKTIAANSVQNSMGVRVLTVAHTAE